MFKKNIRKGRERDVSKNETWRKTALEIKLSLSKFRYAKRSKTKEGNFASYLIVKKEEKTC
jgi:hypothetical protein